MDERYATLLKQTEAWIDAHKDEFVTELQSLTRIPSVSRADLAEPGAPFGKDCRRVLDHALSRGRDYGFETMDHDGYTGSICYGDPENAIGLFAHLDVVPAGDGWIYPPFDAIYLPEHDAVIGRGSDDNKCVAVACLFVMRMLREFGWNLRHGIRLYCGTSEETGMQDMIALLNKGHRFPKLSLVPDSGFPVNYGQKGSVSGDLSIPCSGNLTAFHAGSARNMIPDTASAVLSEEYDAVMKALSALPSWNDGMLEVVSLPEVTQITAKGRSAHAASPGSGINPIRILTRALLDADLLCGSCKNALSELYRLTSDYTGSCEGVAYCDEMSGDLTIAYGVANLTDGRLHIQSDCRTPITCDVEALVKKLSDVWQDRGFTVEKTSFSKPYYIPRDNPHVVALQKLFQEITGRADQPFVMSGGNYARVIPNAISFGPGMPTKKSISDFLPAGRGYCHGKDEAVIMEKVHNCAKIYVLAIAMLDEMLEESS
jgi:succinyl-diaminopimelate desuccinylase